MDRERALRLAPVAAVAGAIAIGAAVLALSEGRRGESTPTPGPAIETRAIVAPRNVLFGDTVRALVEVTIDRNRVEPDSVRVRADFTPWQPVAPVARLRQDGKATTYLRMTYVLRCLVPSCISTEPIATQTFSKARVTYTTKERAGSGGSDVISVAWPELVVGSRYLSDTPPASASAVARLRADLASLPDVTYGMSPSLLVALLIGGSSLFAIACCAFVYLALSRRAPRLDVEHNGPTEPILTPLERALLVLESPAPANGGVDERRALELVAAGLVEHGDLKLARAARALAWSEPVPELEAISGLALQARLVFGEELG